MSRFRHRSGTRLLGQPRRDSRPRFDSAILYGCDCHCGPVVGIHWFRRRRPPSKTRRRSAARLMQDAAVKARGRRERAPSEPRPSTIKCRLCEVEAPPFKETKRAQLYAQMFRDIGLRNVRIDKEGNVLGERPGSQARPHLVFSAHLDTVFPEGTDVTVKREGTMLRGPGIGDDCRGLAVVLAVDGRSSSTTFRRRHDHVCRHGWRRRPRRSARREASLRRRPERTDRSLRVGRWHRARHHAHCGWQPAISRDIQGTRWPQLWRVRDCRIRFRRWAARWRASRTSKFRASRRRPSTSAASAEAHRSTRFPTRPGRRWTCARRIRRRCKSLDTKFQKADRRGGERRERAVEGAD